MALHSQGTVEAVQLIADMYHKHKIIPKGAIAWDNTGNNKAYQSRQVHFRPESYQYLCLSGGLRQRAVQRHWTAADAGRAGRRRSRTLSTAEWMLFKHNPYPEVAKGLAEYWMAPENLRVMIEEGDGRWGPPYKGMYDSDFWKRPVFHALARRCWSMAGNSPPPARRIPPSVRCHAPTCIGRMMHRVLVENWEAEKAVEEAHKKIVEIYARHQEV